MRTLVLSVLLAKLFMSLEVPAGSNGFARFSVIIYTKHICGRHRRRSNARDGVSHTGHVAIVVSNNSSIGTISTQADRGRIGESDFGFRGSDNAVFRRFFGGE